MRSTFEVLVDAVRILFSIIAIIFIIISTVLILIKLFGNNPTEITIMLSITSIIFALLGVVISVLFGIKGDLGELKEFKRLIIDKTKDIQSGVVRLNERISKLEGKRDKYL